MSKEHRAKNNKNNSNIEQRATTSSEEHWTKNNKNSNNIEQIVAKATIALSKEHETKSTEQVASNKKH